MGFLDVGTPLSWEDSQSVIAYVKEHGLLQLLRIWNTNKNRSDPYLRWGEEIEYSLVDVDSENSLSRVYSNAAEILERLELREHLRPRTAAQLASEWHPEFANHMIEAIPSPPYPLNVSSILLLEPSMRLRRAKIQLMLPESAFVTSLTAFPRLGLPDFSTPGMDINENHATNSVFIPDALITPHPRFGTLVKNIRARRGANPDIRIPLYKDAMTGSASKQEGEWSLAAESPDRFEVEALAKTTFNPVQNQIFMDCFAFGMGMSCVQTTFATRDIDDARYLYDQMAVLAPLFLALTAATPFQRGLLSAYDTRWSTLEQAVDCRTVDELKTIPKSRYSGVSRYIVDDDEIDTVFNDSIAPINDQAKELLMSEGMDRILASHFGHLWIRDPMVIFGDKIHLDDARAVDHFENIQSTNWNSIRFKPPPPNMTEAQYGPIGWRVEFRTPENQLTDFDNAAGVAIISVIAQAIMKNRVSFYIPMTKNDENMQRSWVTDSILNQKFHFRRDVSAGTKNYETAEMTMTEILTGGHGFRGLLTICQEFLDEAPAGSMAAEARTRFDQFCNLYIERAAGRVMTCAHFMRKFIMKHPSYNHDSIINEKICHDLTTLSTNIGFGLWGVPSLHGSLWSLIPQTPLPASVTLPKLSVEGDKLFCFKNQSSPSLNGRDALFTMIQKRMVVLNEIESIYTMPLGVTARFSPTSGVFDMSCAQLLQEKGLNTPTCCKSYCGGTISNEDFTRAWLMNGYDNSPIKTLQIHQVPSSVLCCDGKGSGGSGSSPSCCDFDDSAAAHDLSRSLSLGFETEEDLEYYKQVCDASA